MTAVIVCIAIGYLLGCLSPAAMFSVIHKKDVSKHGTGNRGATNTMLVLGKKYGILVMIMDIMKAYLAVKIAKALFPMKTFAWVLTGCFAVIGHVFPFYLQFKGGKGLAAFGGMILGIDPILFPILLVLCVIIMLVANNGYAMSISASVLFPVMYVFRSDSYLQIFLAVVASAIVLWQNLKAALNANNETGKTKIREYLKSRRDH